MTSKSGKQYGLILSKKGSGQDVIQRPSVFDDDSDSNESGAGEDDWRKRSYQRETTKPTLKKQTKIQMQKALDEDPSIYQYDEVYEDIKEAKSKTAPKKEDNKKQSRYIQSLKRNAEKRKLENERRLERQVQKERVEEGEQFRDKETFVTSSYKKKLEEFQKFDEEEQRMDRLEEIGDVTKQKDMSGFYRHIYRSTFDPEKEPEPTKEEDKVVKEEPKETAEKTATADSQKENFKLLDNSVKQKRHYRRRKRSRSSKEEGEKTSSSSESSSSSSSSQSESEEEPPPSKVKKTEKDDPKPGQDKLEGKKKTISSLGKENERIKINLDDVKSDLKEKKIKLSPGIDQVKVETNTTSTNDEIKEAKPTINIWVKRTVGIIFDNALQRYLERKSNRKGSY